MSAPDARRIAAILAIEDEYRPFERKIGGLQYWPLLRLQLAATTDRAPPAVRLWDRAATAIVQDAKSAFQSDCLGLKRRGTILIPFHRKQVRAGQVHDRFLQPVLDDPRFGPFCALEGDLASDRLRPSSDIAVSPLNRGRVAGLVMPFLSIKGLLQEARAELDWIQSAYSKRLGGAAPWTAKSLASQVARFNYRKKQLRRRLGRSGACRLISTVSDPALFGAAKDAGLTTIQVQHGAIGPHNLGCHFPGRPLIENFADQYWLFGEYWRDSVALPANCAGRVTGSRTLQGALEDAASEKNPRSVLALSQPPTHPGLLETVVRAAKLAPDWTFVFRAHPREDGADYRRRFQSLAPSANIRLSDAAEDPYPLLASCEVQIGVWSTMLFEGMALGARSIVLDLPGSSVLQPAIAAGNAVLAHSAEEVIERLHDAPQSQRSEHYFASPVSADALWAFATTGSSSSASS